MIVDLGEAAVLHRLLHAYDDVLFAGHLDLDDGPVGLVILEQHVDSVAGEEAVL